MLLSFYLNYLKKRFIHLINFSLFELNFVFISIKHVNAVDLRDLKFLNYLIGIVTRYAPAHITWVTQFFLSILFFIIKIFKICWFECFLFFVMGNKNVAYGLRFSGCLSIAVVSENTGNVFRSSDTHNIGSSRLVCLRLATYVSREKVWYGKGGLSIPASTRRRFTRYNNVVDVQTTQLQRKNDVVCFTGWQRYVMVKRISQYVQNVVWTLNVHDLPTAVIKDVTFFSGTLYILVLLWHPFCSYPASTQRCNKVGRDVQITFHQCQNDVVRLVGSARINWDPL